MELFFYFFAVMIIKTSAKFDSILKVINKSISSDNFEVSNNIDTTKFLGEQVGVINSEVKHIKINMLYFMSRILY